MWRPAHEGRLAQLNGTIVTVVLVCPTVPLIPFTVTFAPR